jgi:repressor LexA
MLETGNHAGMKNRIAELRRAKGLTAEALAELAGTKKTQLGKLERGERRLSDHWAARLAPHLGVQPYELLMPSGVAIKVHYLPVIGQVSCGNWIEAIEDTSDYVPTTYDSPNAFGLRPFGNSMDKIIKEGGFIVVDPDRLDLIDGKYYVVMNDQGESTAKQYRGNPARLVPCSSDPSYAEISVGRDHFTVVGQIVRREEPL